MPTHRSRVFQSNMEVSVAVEDAREEAQASLTSSRHAVSLALKSLRFLERLNPPCYQSGMEAVLELTEYESEVTPTQTEMRNPNVDASRSTVSACSPCGCSQNQNGHVAQCSTKRQACDGRSDSGPSCRHSWDGASRTRRGWTKLVGEAVQAAVLSALRDPEQLNCK